MTSKIWSAFWLSLATNCSPCDLAATGSTLGGANLCAVSGLFPGVAVENSVERFSSGSDFLPSSPPSSFEGLSQKSKLLALERQAFG